eukprot:CAMPEP_0171890754 /NCGR_PEP_ID=MMETSP0992-20121227/44358_1 /TAXON_ID=483369 /ORGANISM="non described non described, Strain CCMP2098" /LENGTH=73 /DNA_ID=CAMNT_0012518011 /DNA_START=393 /DNA_END=614 /DNA_ORIENTATION=-
MALSASEASSSVMPPDRNVTPGTLQGTTCCSTRTVASAIWEALACKPAAQACPGRTMLGLRMCPTNAFGTGEE